MAERHKVLVAEDDQFQRMSIVDILTMSNYDVTPVENGQQAIDQLEDLDNYFDLVLLDLIMPEMSGKDVLEAMMDDKILSKIPVVVMSARNDKTIISECLATGARTFIVKPLRIQEVKGFESFLKPEEESEADKNLSKYTTVKSLGKGSAGDVELVKNEETGQFYALKTILLSKLSEKERESSECEIHFLKVLTGPTLIKSYHSYIDKEKIMIFMEYAEGGNLADKILDKKIKGEKFDTQTCLNWISQVILGVMFMHSKNILHRDLKSQNLFLASDGTIKIGDFGISKELPTLSSLAKTSCGTPYFMPPEVCKGEPYGEKVDIWAIGCILYELVFLKKPFESNTISGVFDKIINKPLESTYEDVDSNIKMLLMAMLDKDPSRRPSIWELANTPCIHDCISNFVNERGWYEEVATVFECEVGSPTVQHDICADTSVFDTGRLDVITHFIRSDIPVGDCKNGWFTTVANWGAGYDILKWVCTKVEADEDRARTIWQKMVEYGYISRVDGSTDFEPTNTYMYRFYEDREDLAANMIRPYTGSPCGALETSVELVKIIEEVYREAIVEVDYSTKIVAEQALMSKKYETYISSVSKLEKVDLNFYSVKEAYWFFLNVYQSMYVHWYLKNLKSHQDQGEDSSSLFSNLKNLMSKKIPFFYWLGGQNFSIDELKHGVLRGNRKKPGAILRTLNNHDDRAQFIPDDQFDQRILFLCLDLPQVMEHIECFDDPDTLDEKFNFYLREYLNYKVELDTINNEITLPSMFKTYYSDFGGTDEWLLKFVWNWFDNTEYSVEEIINLSRNNFQIKYHSFI